MENTEPDKDNVQDLNKEIYCKKLGHHIPMTYCLSPGQKNFCSSFRNCWFSRMDVEAFLSARYTPEEIETAEKPSTPKVTSIMSILEKFSAQSDIKKE